MPSEAMIKVNIKNTQLLPSGLRFDPVFGVLIAPKARVIEGDNPRLNLDSKEVKEAVKEKRASIDFWREQKIGICQSGILEPFKVRYDEGALDRAGNLKPDGLLKLWDGALRYRATPDYDWYPVIIQDMAADKAMLAAVHTSIHKRLLSAIEEAHAFSIMRDNGDSIRTIANNVQKDPKYVQNRFDLLKLPEDLQAMANQPGRAIMSSLFAIDQVKDDPELRSELKERVEAGSSFAPIKAAVSEYKAAKGLSKESRAIHKRSYPKVSEATLRQREAEIEITRKRMAIRGNIQGIQSYWKSASKEFRDEITPELRELARLLAAVGK